MTVHSASFPTLLSLQVPPKPVFSVCFAHKSPFVTERHCHRALVFLLRWNGWWFWQSMAGTKALFFFICGYPSLLSLALEKIQHNPDFCLNFISFLRPTPAALQCAPSPPTSKERLRNTSAFRRRWRWGRLVMWNKSPVVIWTPQRLDSGFITRYQWRRRAAEEFC